MQSLNISYRPKSFAEVIGQPVIISILSKQIETKKFHNVYLFAGPSGCGKTTCARIFAKNINNGFGEPIEINAASNNGVDGIRELITSAQQAPLDAEYNVYIIDECHMMTTAAWNAALKLIEEPPAHSIFIFCTTDPEKILETVKTRVQRFDFTKVSSSDIANRLNYIVNEELNNTVTKCDNAALTRIADISNGLVREAISLLDKCLAYSSDLTLENVEKCLGLVKYELIINLYNAVVNKDLEKANNMLELLKQQNSNLLVVLDSILGFFIDCAKYQRYNSIKYTNIPDVYVNQITKCDDIMLFVEQAFKYRQLCQTVDADMLLNLIVLELCNR